MALRGYYSSERHDDPFIESHLDIRDAEGNVVPGYGWIFPMGDGRVNVGSACSRPTSAGRASTPAISWTPSWATPRVLGAEPGDLSRPAHRRQAAHGPVGRAPAGGNVLIAGDAGGVINPFNGEGIAYGYETGRLAAAALGHALTGEGAEALADYERELVAAYGPYYKVARLSSTSFRTPRRCGSAWASACARSC